MKLKLYIYKVETNEIVEVIEGESNDECERLAAEANYDWEAYGTTYTDPSAR